MSNEENTENAENETPNVDETTNGAVDNVGDNDGTDVDVITGGIAHVTNLNDGPSSFPEGTTRRAALAEYLEVSPDTVEDSGLVYRLVNQGEIKDLDMPLRDGDVITIYSRSVAKGGFPGGSRRS